MALHRLLFDTTDADTRADGHTIGSILYDAVNDRLGVINTDSELLVHDAGVLAQLISGVAVTATDLDIRDLSFATDSVDVSGSEVSLDAATLAALETITVLQGTSPWVVSATDLDIRDLSASQDNVAISDGTDTLAINNDGSINISDNGGSLTVDASDLDIRDLAHTQDSIRLGDGTDLITSTLEGGKQALDVYVANTIDIDDGLANTAIATAANPLTAANTAENLVASPLASRKYLFAYNNGNKVAYIGASGVSAANGFPVFPGGILEMRAGAAVDIEWVAADTNQEMRTLELS